MIHWHLLTGLLKRDRLARIVREVCVPGVCLEIAVKVLRHERAEDGQRNCGRSTVNSVIEQGTGRERT